MWQCMKVFMSVAKFNYINGFLSIPTHLTYQVRCLKQWLSWYLKLFISFKKNTSYMSSYTFSTLNYPRNAQGIIYLLLITKTMHGVHFHNVCMWC
jgi:hypothetical protein